MTFRPGIENALQRASESEDFYISQKAAAKSWTVYLHGQPFAGCPNEAAAKQLCKDYGGRRCGYTCSQDKKEQTMTSKHEIESMIEWAQSVGATVETITGAESIYEDGSACYRVINLKGCGSFPMGSIAFAERMRELKASAGE